MLVKFIFILSWSVKPLVNSLIYSFFFFLGFLNSSSLKNHTLAGVFCVKASQGEDWREWSISPNLISCIPPPPPPPTTHPLVTMPLCAAPTSLVPSLLQPTCEMLFCCLVPPQLEHLPLDPPPHPSAFPPFNLNNASFFQPHYVDCFQRTSKKEKQIEVAGDNETAGWTEAVHLAFLYFLCHVWANVHFGFRGKCCIFPSEVITWNDAMIWA